MEKKNFRPASLPELKARQALEASALMRISGTGTLPLLPPLPLGDLQIELKLPAPISEMDITDRLAGAIRQRSPRRTRGLGEAIAPGDDLTLDIVGFCDGKVLPFSARAGFEATCMPDMYVAGFYERLAGAKVGDRLQISLKLPDDFPGEAFRGKQAVFAVHLLASEQVTPLDPKDPSFFQRLRLGATREEAEAHLVAVVGKDKELELQRGALDQIVAELRRRAPPVIPEPLIDQVLGARWKEQEGNLLSKFGLSADDQEHSLKTWLSHPPYRQQIRDSLIRTQLLVAIAQGEGLTITHEDLKKQLAAFAPITGLSPAKVEKELMEDPSDIDYLWINLLLIKATQHLLNRCAARLAGAPARPQGQAS